MNKDSHIHTLPSEKKKNLVNWANSLFSKEKPKK